MKIILGVMPVFSEYILGVFAGLALMWIAMNLTVLLTLAVVHWLFEDAEQEPSRSNVRDRDAS